MLIILLSVDLCPDVVGDCLGDSDREVSLGRFDNVVDQLRVFQHGVAIGNEEQIGARQGFCCYIRGDGVLAILVVKVISPTLLVR